MAKPVEVETYTEHRVRSGETLESLARQAKSTVQTLLLFNFGTTNRAEVNAALYAYVGCRKRSPDGKNYLFDDHDRPGILYLPKPIPQLTGKTDEHQEIRLKMPQYKGSLAIQTVDETGLAVGNVSLVLRPVGWEANAQMARKAGSGSQDSKESGFVKIRTDQKGCGFAEGVAAGRYGVYLEDGTPAFDWQGVRPSRDVKSAVRMARQAVQLVPAYLSTLHPEAVPSVVVRQDLSDEERAARGQSRHTYASSGDIVRIRPRGTSIGEQTEGLSGRTIRLCCDTLLLAAGWTDGSLSKLNIQGLVRDILPEWLDDHCALLREQQYYVILLEPTFREVKLLTAGGEQKGEWNYRADVVLIGLCGAYTLFASGENELYQDILSRTYPIVDRAHSQEVISIRDIIIPAKRASYVEAEASLARQTPHSVLLSIPTAMDLRRIALQGGSGLLEEYGSGGEVNQRIHARNLKVCSNIRRAYDAYVKGYVRGVKGCSSEVELRSLGPPLAPYYFPAMPVRASQEQRIELVKAGPETPVEPWEAIAQKLDELADRKSEGFPFMRMRLKYELDAAGAADLAKLPPKLAELAKRTPYGIEIEGNLEIQLTNDGVRVIKRGTSWKFDLKYDGQKINTAKAGTKTGTGQAVQAIATGSPRAIFDGVSGYRRSSSAIDVKSGPDSLTGKVEGERGSAEAEIKKDSARLTMQNREGGKGTVEIDQKNVTATIEQGKNQLGAAYGEDGVSAEYSRDGKSFKGAVTKDKVSITVGPYTFDIKGNGDSKASVNLGPVTVDSGWVPRTAEMTAGFTLPFGKLAKALKGHGGVAEKYANYLSGLTVRVEVGLVGLTVDTALATFARTRGLFQRRSLDELFSPDIDWNSLQFEEQTDLANLGWTPETWDSKYDAKARKLPKSCDKEVSQLTSAEMIAIKDLGYYRFEDYRADVKRRLGN